MLKFLSLLVLVFCANFYLGASTSTKLLSYNQYQDICSNAVKLHGSKDLSRAIDRLAQEITAELAYENPIIICVLKGGIVATGQLLPRLNFPLQVDYINVTRYENSIVGEGLKVLAEPQQPLEGRTILIVDDIIDEGVTLQRVVNYCQNKGAKKVLTAVIIDKNQPRAVEGLQDVDFKGLKIPNKFVIGYGLDYKNYFRNLDGIYVMPFDKLF